MTTAKADRLGRKRKRETPHGAVSERFMRHHYGANKGVPDTRLEDAAQRIFTHAIDWNEGRKSWDMELVKEIIRQEVIERGSYD